MADSDNAAAGARGPREDFVRILEHAVPTAQTMIEKDGSFAPFACVVTQTGELQIEHTQLSDDQSVADVEKQQREQLNHRLRQGGLRSAASVSNVTAFNKDESGLCDAVVVIAVHRDGTSAAFFHPYGRSPSGTTWGKPFSRT
jgi:hypothetical protein